MQNPIKAKLAQGEVTVGTWSMIGHPVVAEILAQAGFDWIVLDMEHGVVDWPQALGLVQAIEGRGCMPICRLPINEPEHFKWALDTGAGGVMVPLIRSVEDAERAVMYAKYPPEGIRGISICRAHGYGATFQSYVETANEETLVVLQIEHIDAVNEIEDICAVPGVDAVFIGPYDLSGSMGLMGQIHHPQVEDAVSRVFEAAVAADVAPGLLIVEPAPGEVARRISDGFQFIAVGLDTLMLVRAAEDLMDQWRAAPS
ncbi:MAG: HpcH/HpaI aldolase family protein [Anaerolineae bacterium]